MCVSVSCLYPCACMYLVTMDAKDGIKTPEIGVIDFCELPGACWESNCNPLSS